MTGVNGSARAGSSVRVQLPWSLQDPTRNFLHCGTKWPSPDKQSLAKLLGSPLCHSDSMNSETRQSNAEKEEGYPYSCIFKKARKRETASRYLLCVAGATTNCFNVPKARRSLFRSIWHRLPSTCCRGIKSFCASWPIDWAHRLGSICSSPRPNRVESEQQDIRHWFDGAAPANFGMNCVPWRGRTEPPCCPPG